MALKDTIKQDDWKNEKHVPVMELPAGINRGEPTEVRVSVGKEIGHPNTASHHIAWIKLFFFAEGAKFPVEVADFHFSEHGADAEDETANVVTEHDVTARITFNASGQLQALSYCNLHGLWQNEMEINLD